MVAQRNDSASQWHVVVSLGLSLVLLICLFAGPAYLHAEELSSPKQLPQTQTSSTDPVAPKVPTKAGSAAGSSSSTPPAQAQSTSTEPVAPKTPAKPGITAESPGSTQAQLVQAQSTSTQSTALKAPTQSGTTTTTSTASVADTSGSTPSYFSLQSFAADVFTGAASAEIPISVPPGTAGVTPKIFLRYDSGFVDDLGRQEKDQSGKLQGQWTGFGWTLDTGGYIIRDSQGTITADDDRFRLVFGGRTYQLKSVGSGRYRTKDETFWLINYNSTGNYWTLKTKDGTTHKFGSAANSRQIGMTFALNQEASATFTYFVDEVSTTSGTLVRYSYFKQSSSYNNRAYDQAVYIDTITYSYRSGSLVI